MAAFGMESACGRSAARPGDNQAHGLFLPSSGRDACRNDLVSLYQINQRGADVQFFVRGNAGMAWVDGRNERIPL